MTADSVTAGAVARAASLLLRELLEGSGSDPAGVLNAQDPGLLRSLEFLSAEAASAVPPGAGASIAAQADHLRYGLELLNRWSEGADPFADADYRASWRRVTVSDREWRALRDDLRREARAWLAVVADGRRMGGLDLTGVLASIVHLAYHLGAVRQMNRALRGPSAND